MNRNIPQPTRYQWILSFLIAFSFIEIFLITATPTILSREMGLFSIIYIALYFIEITIPIKHRAIFIVFSLDVAAAILLGPWWSSIFLSLIILINIFRYRDRSHPSRVIFNFSMSGLALLASYWFYQWLMVQQVADVLAIIAVSAVYQVINLFLLYVYGLFGERKLVPSFVKEHSLAIMIDFLLVLVATLSITALFNQFSMLGLFIMAIVVGVASWLLHWHSRYASQRSKLSEYRVRNQFLLDAMDYGILAIDQSQTITLYNEHMAQIHGVAPEDALGRKYHDVFGGLKEEDQRLLHTLQSGASYHLVKQPFENQGKHFYLDTYTQPVRNSDGEIMGAIGLYRDVTEEKQLEQEMIQKDKLSLVGQLAAGTAHEIRNPLATAMGHLQLATRKLDAVGQEEILRHLKVVQHQLDRANNTISNLLSWSKPKKVERERVDIQDIIDDAIEWTYHSAVSRGIELISQEYPAEAYIFVDEEQVKQVLVNLLYNAFEATPKGGRVRMFAEDGPDKDDISIVVEDNGIGMDAATVARLGQAFYTTKNEGTGLGLLMSYRIIRSHGGRIEIQSEKGVGTRFWVLFKKSH